MRYLLSIAVVVAAGSGCATVGTGQAGVLWRSSGGTDPVPLGEGWHYVSPRDEVVLYNLRTQQRNEKLHVLASNGLSLSFDTTIRFHVTPNEVSALHKEVGAEYYDVILGPALRSRARRVVGRYTPEGIYSTKRELIEREIREEVEKAIGGKHIVLEAILVRDVDLPDMIQRAIVDKLSEEQRSLKMKFVIEHEQQEAERKKIEAQGIEVYQEIVSRKISEPQLRWKQIEALDHLALSTNAKVIMFGAGRDSPLVLETPR